MEEYTPTIFDFIINWFTRIFEFCYNSMWRVRIGLDGIGETNLFAIMLAILVISISLNLFFNTKKRKG